MKYVNTTLNDYILVLLLDLLKREEEGLVNRNGGTQVLYLLTGILGPQFDPGDPQNH